ncbi:MAG: TraB/GumN family protein, partial [Pseudomonadota bacterium]|nr:TraB/GumN family protein [Pseudomonadota bacterium]
RHLDCLAGVLFSVAALTTATASAASGAAPQPGRATADVPATAAQAPPLPLLWKVSDADNSVYLLGSFHLLKTTDYPVSSDIEAALDAADKVVFEVTPEQLKDPENGRNFMLAAAYDDARTLSDVLPTQMRAQLAALLAPNGGSVEQLDAFEPWFVNLMLVLGLAQSQGFDPKQGLDQYLMGRAAAAGKPTGGLESMATQLAALETSPMPEQIKSLADYLDRSEEMPQMLDDMHRAWREGDAAHLEALAVAEMRDNTPVTYRTVVVDRNNAWMPQLQGMLDGADTSDTLVVVGALHLVGEDSVVATLRARGYAVERICSACEAGSAAR